MKKVFLIVLILFVSVLSTACINNLAVQELNNKAKSYLDKGDFEDAINRLNASIDLDSTIYETHYNLGIAYTQAEKYPEAIDAFKKTLKLKPDFSDAYYSMAVAQENYAQDVIGGTLNKKTDEKSATVETPEKEHVLTKDEKSLVSQLLNDAINSYEKYLSTSTQAKDKQEVQEKIASLKTSVTKYSAK